MVTKLEAIRGGGGSVKVGTVGTVGSLMTRELELSKNRASRVPSSSQPSLVSRSHCHGHLRPRTCVDTPSKHRNPAAVWRTRNHAQQKQKPPSKNVGDNTINRGSRRSDFPCNGRNNNQGSYRIPMLDAENISLESTPIQDKPMKKKSNIVDMVDIGCGKSRAPLSTRLKKLGFSKMSQTFM